MAQETNWDTGEPGGPTTWDRDWNGPGTRTVWDLIPDVLQPAMTIVWTAIREIRWR